MLFCSNDSLVKKLEELERTEIMYKGLVDHTRAVLRGTFDLLILSREMGDVFCNIGVREPQKAACEAFCKFGEYHRQMERSGIRMLKATKPILQDLGTYLTKAIPDTKLTIKKYADVKFEYLSYCLKVKELDDEDASYMSLGEPLYRVETGNYEYRLVLRCRADAKRRFARMRSDVLTKLELLDNKHVQDIVFQLKRLMCGLTTFHKECQELMGVDAKLFPVEIDFDQSTCKPVVPQNEENEEVILEEDGIDSIIPEFDQASEDKSSQLIAPSTEPQANLLDMGDNLGQDQLIPTSNGDKANFLDMGDPLGQNELIPTSNGDIGQLIEDPTGDTKTEANAWDENWLLGPNHEQSIPKNTEPGGDIDLLLMDN